MIKQLVAKDYIKDNFKKLPFYSENVMELPILSQNSFKRIYSPFDQNRSIDFIVDNIDEDKLEACMDHIKNTLKMLNNEPL